METVLFESKLRAQLGVMYLELKRLCLEDTVETWVGRKLGYKSKYLSPPCCLPDDHRINQSVSSVNIGSFHIYFLHVECLEHITNVYYISHGILRLDRDIIVNQSNLRLCIHSQRHKIQR